MVGGWCAGQSVPLPAACAGLVLCPWFSPDGAGVWSQQGLQDGAALAVAAFRVYAPPRPGCRFSRSLGPLPRVLALVAYASRAEPGSYRGRSRERPQVLDVQAKLCRGSRWALESRLMLSPLLCEVTAQKPRRFADLAGFRFWAAPKACCNHTRQPPRLGNNKTTHFVIVK